MPPVSPVAGRNEETQGEGGAWCVACAGPRPPRVASYISHALVFLWKLCILGQSGNGGVRVRIPSAMCSIVYGRRADGRLRRGDGHPTPTLAAPRRDSGGRSGVRRGAHVSPTVADGRRTVLFAYLICFSSPFRRCYTITLYVRSPKNCCLH